ncbi:PDC sensor domain-containing protein [Candidatus Venteria ishoeyi]|uniref:Cache domain-containing protein n=1 Tax=Candidatus Venteria ishoeyi TaxID=1899563 RepID=A0A1H6FBJ9_9GAMM|nr:PDC sensor domain-containing protein [Candidatus Venteria ishoeyi]SEH07458.1 Uncharacterised protein [Candidatus Venteria ishoeyi]
MRHSIPMKLAWGVLLFLCTNSAWANETPKAMRVFTERYLQETAKHETFVLAVQTQNTLQTSLTSIKQQDTTWRNTPGIDSFMWDLMRNDCALILFNLQQIYPFISEAFVMDQQGALVCLTYKTTDYWQGDEAKFTESYRNGQGAIYYSDAKYDLSTDEIMIQISVPVMSETDAIGVIMFGISLDRWERR